MKTGTSHDTIKKRTVFEIVTEDGTMHPREICSIIQALCDTLKKYEDPDCNRIRRNICPQSVIVSTNDGIELSQDVFPVSLREAYIPPEQSRDNTVAITSVVYPLGMLMLFMATGNTDKTELDSFYLDKQLKSVIEKCIFLDPRLRFQSETELSKTIRNSHKILKNLRIGLLVLLGILIAAVFAFLLFQAGNNQGRVAGKAPGYNDGYAAGYEQGYSDAHGIGIGPIPFDGNNGNNSGNTINGAFCARSEKELYYIVKGSLYRMNPYTGDTELMVQEAGAQCICYYDGWLYYSTEQAVMRIDPASRKSEAVCTTKAGLLYIVDGSFYLDSTSKGGYIYRFDPNSGELKQLNDRTEYDCLNIIGNQLYYIDPDQNKTLVHSDLDGGNKKLLSSYRFKNICIYGKSIYGYASDNNQDGRLISMDLNGGGIRHYTDTRISCLNVTEGGMFFVSGDSHRLEWMSLQGDARFTILPSHVGRFNVLDRWIIYQNEADGGNLWCVRIDGTDRKKLS